MENDNILEQGSFLKDRVFLSSQKERKKLQSLLSEKITGDEFLNSRDVTLDSMEDEFFSLFIMIVRL